MPSRKFQEYQCSDGSTFRGRLPPGIFPNHQPSKLPNVHVVFPSRSLRLACPEYLFSDDRTLQWENSGLDIFDPPTDAAAVVQGFLGIAEHFGEEEVVVLEAILVHEIGLWDANVLFSEDSLVRSFLFAAVLSRARGSWRLLPRAEQSPQPFILRAVISDLVTMNVMRRSPRFRRNRGTSRMCWFSQSIHS